MREARAKEKEEFTVEHTLENRLMKAPETISETMIEEPVRDDQSLDNCEMQERNLTSEEMHSRMVQSALELMYEDDEW